MKSFLPEISSRSYTPISTRNIDYKSKSNFPTNQVNSVKHISAGPLSTRSSRRSSDYFNKSRAGSDNMSIVLENDSFLYKMKNSFSHKYNKSKPAPGPALQTKNLSNVVQALFNMCSNEKGRVSAHALANLLVSIGLSEKIDQVHSILQGISEGLSIDIISFSKQDLMKICEDSKTGHMLQEIVKDLNYNSSCKLSAAVQVLRRWWSKLDKSQTGFVATDDIIKFLTDIRAVESTSDIKRMYLKMSQFGDFKQFASVFSRSLLKFLLIELSSIVDQSSNKFVSPDIRILELRRKMILSHIDTRGKVLASI